MRSKTTDAGPHGYNGIDYQQPDKQSFHFVVNLTTRERETDKSYQHCHMMWKDRNELYEIYYWKRLEDGRETTVYDEADTVVQHLPQA